MPLASLGSCGGPVILEKHAETEAVIGEHGCVRCGAIILDRR
jgi:hypothetical protein